MFSASRKGSYVAQAGQANPLLDAFSVASAYSFNPFDLAKSGMKADTAKYISKKENEAKRDYYQTMGESSLEGMKTLEKAGDYAAGQQRMAGGLGLLGALSYGTSRYFQDQKNQLPPPEKRQSADYSGTLEALSAQLEDLKTTQQEISDFRDKYGSLDKLTNTNTATNTSTETSTTGGVTPSSGGSSTAMQFNKPGWKSLGATIKFAEGTFKQGDRAYNTGYGYNMFEDLSKHPDKVFNNTSAAAGAYQFMPKTWKTVVQPKLNLPDFGPQSQEKAGEYLTNYRGVQTDKPFKTVSELRSAFDKLAPEWASIPLSSTGKSYYDGDGINSARSFASLRDFYEKQVGYKLID